MTTAPSPPQVPGLVVSALVAPPVPGRPAAWWAVDEDGRDVVVQRVRPAGGTGPVAGLDEASLRRRLAHPHAVPLLRVARCREGAVQVLGPVAGGSLVDLLHERDRLDAGEVAVLVAGVGSALGALHEVGLVHGEVCAAGVLVDHAGLPLLLGWGGARSALPEGVRRRELRARSGSSRARPPAPRTADDVRALARLGLAALGHGHDGDAVLGGADGADRGSGATTEDGERRTLLAVLRGAAAAQGAAVPTAEELARACWQAAQPVPLGAGRGVLVGTADADAGAATAVTQRIRRSAARAAAPAAVPGARRGAGSRLRSGVARHPLRWAGGLLVLALLTGAAAALGAAPALDDRLTGDDPAAAVAALADLRLRAVVEHDAELLARVDVPGSEAALADAQLLAQAAGTRVEGASTRVLSAAVQERDGDRAWVEVVTVVSAHRAVSGGRRVDVPQSDPVTSRLLLHRDAGSWKVAATA